MPKYLIADRRLGLSSFKVYRQVGTSWPKASNLRYGRKYRFRFRLFNDYRETKPSYTLHQIEISNAPGFRWYWSSSYSGKGWTGRYWESSIGKRIRPQRGYTHYVYFIWRGRDGTQVNQVSPSVLIGSHENAYSDSRPPAPLVPNVR